MLIDKFEEIEALDTAIANTLNKLSGFEPETEEYARIVDQLTKLMKIKEMIGNLKVKAKDSGKSDRVSKDTLAMIGANLVGIGLILGYERVNVIASKALGFVLKR